MCFLTVFFSILFPRREANTKMDSEFSQTEVLRQLIHLLRAPDVDLNLSCLQVIRRVIAQSSEALGICAGLGLHDTLDDIQVRGAGRLAAVERP